ncbi:MAG: hypothetical protein KF687_01330 [Cyclobacteriaceae bacterium]|nr:hypothetical protein [Cyclobacteriaceae bacterium]
MRHWVIILMLFGGLVSATDNRSSERDIRRLPSEILQPYLETTAAAFDQKMWDSFVLKLSKKHASKANEVSFIRYLFNQTHNQYLKRFSSNATFASVFADGSYNCLTGTILFSVLLDHFKIEHRIIETNYHIFILIQNDDLLIEITDPNNGFITGKEDVANRIEKYRLQGVDPVNPRLAYYEYSFELYNEVSDAELIGLLYYNLAVDSFNQSNLKEAVRYLSRAIERYASPRIEEFAEILLLAVHESRLQTQEKILCKKELQTIRYKAMLVMAEL